MIAVVAEAGVDYVCMDWRGGADAAPPSGRIAGAVVGALAVRRDHLIEEGLDPARIILDPGLGFGKSDAQNWELVGALRRVCDLGPRVLVGHSRKRFVGALLPPHEGADARDAASAAVSALCAAAGVWGVRVHDARSTARILASTSAG
jgi:dihydropteroate synthase